VRGKGEVPDFEKRGLGGLFPSTAAHSRYGFVPGTGTPIEFDAAVYAGRGPDERWIAELVIENPLQERYALNIGRWWKLPRRTNAAALFVDSTACRVGSNHRICADVHSQQQGVILNIPDELSLFRSLILPRRPEWLQKFAPPPSAGGVPSLYLRVSDKGRYLSGFLGLFDSVKKAAYVLEDFFWRGVIESLSTPRASTHTREKVRNDLSRSGVTDLRSAEGVEFAVAEIIDIAGRIQRPRGYLTFGDLIGRYRKYLADMPVEEQAMELSVDATQVRDAQKLSEAVHANLRGMLSNLTSREVFLQGVEVRCSHCLTSLWYHIDDLRSTIACRGCRYDISLPAEIPWSYSLNELVASAVRDHGVVPVIRTVYRLFQGSRECFCFLGGLEVRDYRDDSQKCELDLAWIKDGEFGLAEIKSSPKKFKAKEGLVQTLSEAAPDRYLLACTSGTNQEMQEECSRLQSRVGSRVRVEAWDPAAFSISVHSGWEVGTIKLL
jgi:hypothetical protein